MDFLTHSLAGAGAARLLKDDPSTLPQLSFTAMFSTLLIDADPWLYLVDPNWYGRYHRVVSHSLIGMLAIIVISGLLCALLFQDARGRRFGWFISDNLPAHAAPRPVALGLLMAAASCGVVTHWVLDVITGFGNMLPLWPWSQYDASLHAVISFDPLIFSATLGWHILLRWKKWPRRKELLVTIAYAGAIAVYVILRYAFGEPTFI